MSGKYIPMKLLVVADVYGDFTTLGKIIEKARDLNPDVVICPGNITDMFAQASDFSQLDVADIIIQKLLSLGKPVLCVPGNHDPYDIIDVFEEYGVNLHGKHRVVNNHHFIGFGGAKTPFNTPFEPSEEEVKEHLERLPNTQPLIMVTHNPPKDTKLDVVKKKHVGSLTIREEIQKKKPLVAIAAHILEGRGVDVLDSTTLFNPGPAFKGFFGMVNIGKKVLCEKKSL